MERNILNMKKTTILHILYFIILISSISANNYITVSGNTFSIPSGNEENNSYHTYNIENNENQYNSENYIIGNQPRSTSTPGNNTANNNNTAQQDKTPVTWNNTKSYTKNTQHKYNKNKANNTSPVIRKNKTKKLPANNNKSSGKNITSKKQTIKSITKIEFQKHFIKIPAGNSEEILFTTTPVRTSGLNFIYKSNDNSVAIFKDKKLTALKKGFTTILIILPDNTIKAACPVKVI